MFINIKFRVQRISVEPYRIIFQLTDGDSSSQIKFIGPLYKILKVAPNAQTEVVALGKGIDLPKVKNTPYGAQLQQLKERGIEFLIIENTLNLRKLKNSSFYFWKDLLYMQSLKWTSNRKRPVFISNSVFNTFQNPIIFG